MKFIYSLTGAGGVYIIKAEAGNGVLVFDIKAGKRLLLLSRIKYSYWT